MRRKKKKQENSVDWNCIFQRITQTSFGVEYILIANSKGKVYIYFLIHVMKKIFFCLEFFGSECCLIKHLIQMIKIICNKLVKQFQNYIE